MVKTVVAFKEIFAVVKKKPRMPKVIKNKDKKAIESDVDENEEVKLRQDLNEMFKTDPDYTVDLMAYKLAKHLDDKKKGDVWTSGIGSELLEKVALKIIPRDLSDPATEQQYRKAQKAQNMPLLRLFGARDRDGTMRLNQQDTAATDTASILAAFQKNDKAAMETLGKGFGGIIAHGDPVKLAKANPEMFFDTVMAGFKLSPSQFTEAFANPKVRSDLRAACPKEWADFAAETPMLATLDKISDTVGALPNPSEADKLNQVFDAILDPAVMPLTYVASASGFRNIDILTGPTKDNSGPLDKLKADTGAPGPATDCHNLQNLTIRLAEAALGKPVPRASFPKTPEQIKSGYPGEAKGKAKGMVLTRSLKAIGGKGLIGSFQGNVFDEKGAPTGKVFFTGDGKGDSHSWLVLNVPDGTTGKTKEVAFDPVLGTKGPAVEQAIDEQSIAWADEARGIAKTPKGWYLVLDSTKSPGPNKVGIKTYYTITKTAPKGLTA